MKVYYPLRYAFDFRTGVYTGYVYLANIGTATKAGPFTLTFPVGGNYPILLNPTGYAAGQPYITVNGIIKPKRSIKVLIQLSNQFRVRLSTFFIGFPIAIS